MCHVPRSLVAADIVHLLDAVGSYLCGYSPTQHQRLIVMNPLVWSSKLRSIGLTGFGRETASLIMPSIRIVNGAGRKLALHRPAQDKTTMIVVDVRNDVHLLSPPKWCQLYVYDIVATRALRSASRSPQTRNSFVGQLLAAVESYSQKCKT